MYDQHDHGAHATEPGVLAATAMALVVLIVIIVLFLLLKFNLFDGGKPANLPSTAPAPRTLVLAA
jgi:hypothetical protein